MRVNQSKILTLSAQQHEQQRKKQDLHLAKWYVCEPVTLATFILVRTAHTKIGLSRALPCKDFFLTQCSFIPIVQTLSTQRVILFPLLWYGGVVVVVQFEGGWAKVVCCLM